MQEWRGTIGPASVVALPAESSRCTLVNVSPLENIVDDLKSLPPDRLAVAANLIRQLKPISQVEREAALARTFGCLSREEADEMERVIEEGCEQINEHGW
jgi:hypothetical protein